MRRASITNLVGVILRVLLLTIVLLIAWRVVMFFVWTIQPFLLGVAAGFIAAAILFLKK